MYYIVPDLQKMNSFKDVAIPSAGEMYRRGMAVDCKPSGSDEDEVLSYNHSSKLDQVAQVMDKAFESEDD